MLNSIPLQFYVRSYPYTTEPKDPYEEWYGLFFILLPFILVLVYLWYMRVKNKHKIVQWANRKVPLSYSDFTYCEIQVVLAVVMIKRDPSLIVNKRQLIHQFLAKYALSDKVDLEDIFEFFLNSKIPLNELVDWCNIHASYEQKLESFELLARLALLDGDLLDVEMQYLLFILQKFGIQHEDIELSMKERIFGNSRKEETRMNTSSGYSFHFEVLGITEKSSPKEIKDAYRALVKKYHPDSHPGISDKEKEVLAVKFRQVQESYEMIVNS